MRFWTELRNQWLVILTNQEESMQITRPVKRMTHSFFVVLARSIAPSASTSSSPDPHTLCCLVPFFSLPSSMIVTKLLNLSHAWYSLL